MKLQLPITLYSPAPNRVFLFFCRFFFLKKTATSVGMCLEAEKVSSCHTGIHKINRYKHECQKEVQKTEKGRDGFTTGEAGHNDGEESGRTVE